VHSRSVPAALAREQGHVGRRSIRIHSGVQHARVQVAILAPLDTAWTTVNSMTKPVVSLSMRSGSAIKEGEFTPKAGTEIEVEYDPAKVSISTDYSKQDKLVVRVDGESRLKLIGLPSIAVSAGGEISSSGWSASSGLKWEINSEVSAKIEYEYKGGSHSAMATMRIRF
jgi:opacity protein-like surface antigen